jgi:hypothetical protein
MSFLRCKSEHGNFGVSSERTYSAPLTSIPLFMRLLLIDTHVGLVKITKIVNLIAVFFFFFLYVIIVKDFSVTNLRHLS